MEHPPPWIVWFTFNDLLQRWGTPLVANVFEAVKGGLAIYEESVDLQFNKLEYCEAIARYSNYGAENPTHDQFRFRVEDIVAFERLRSNACTVDKSTPAESRLLGGRSPGPLKEAVQYLYEKFLKEGEVSVLRSGNSGEFIKRMRIAIKDDARNQHYLDYVAERIQSVKKTGGGWIIVNHPRKEPRRAHVESAPYSQNAVSKILTELREKTPLP